jgi:phosphatidylglycerol:prolipoprotein diacylglycerol transferase
MFILAQIDPILFQWGPITVRWYGVIFAAAIYVAIWMTMRSAKERGLDPEVVPDLGLVIVPAGVLGARLYEVFVLAWDQYKNNWGDILAVWKGGLAIHGGVIGAILVAAIYTWRKKLSFWLWADMIAPGLILAQAIGRWGNFFNQEAYGSNAPQWVIDLMPGFIREGMLIGGAVKHPTFLYESVWNLGSFVLLYLYQRRKPAEGSVISLYFILYNLGRLVIETIREDSSFFYGMRIAQLMAIAQILIGLVLLYWHKRRTKVIGA